MLMRTLGLCGALLSSLAAPAQQAGNNDGFQRRNGQMVVVRNGQARPMAHDVHLPTGATVTKDGFVVSPSGQRAELREGQGCDLRGRPVAVRQAPNGSLTLAAPAAAVPVENAPRSVLAELFGEGNYRYFKHKKAKKKHGKGKGHGRWKGEDD
ncbi:DUF6799 domain-containing protein [Hymenobacter sp. BT523]|uniref:DUF6799 domain-containing protein n=1 Tax=Hymenobacter sp. BT523 TaxID=2795725 RepID=UPI0018EC1210|nr:DUF6799 domain-containing protein [Hymenobacter sp. BT523]